MKAMIDIETLGTSANAPIIQIGLAFWDKSGDIGGLKWDTIPGDYSQPDWKTVAWWMDQVRQGVPFPTGKIALDAALTDLQLFMQTNDFEEVWAWSPSFDLVILDTAYRHYGIKKPWHYRDERDCRTLARLVRDLRYVKGPAAHDALEDAKAQARWTIRALERISQ